MWCSRMREDIHCTCERALAVDAYAVVCKHKQQRNGTNGGRGGGGVHATWVAPCGSFSTSQPSFTCARSALSSGVRLARLFV